jgi:hypothetical protein
MKKDFARQDNGFRNALKSLPAEQREALILVDASGFSFEEAALICECTVRAIRRRVNRARSRVGEILSVENASDFTVYIDMSGSLKNVGSTKADNHNPPKLAEFLLIALSSPSRGESMIGDLKERFAREFQELGRDRAVRLYWARTLRSLWPLLRRAIGKALKWGAVIAAVKRIFDHTAA